MTTRIKSRRVILLWAVGAAGVLVADIQGPIRAQPIQQIDPIHQVTPTVSASAKRVLEQTKTIQGKYVTLSLMPPMTAISPVRAATLILRVIPRPKMHLYAPGQKGYIPVALEIANSPAYRALPIRYPKAMAYEFAPLQERVQVYERPFMLNLTLMIKSPADLAKAAVAGVSVDPVVVSGTFSYQACDDQVCYRPETLQLEWKVPLGAR